MIPMFVSMGMMAMMRSSMGGGPRFMLMSLGMGVSGIVVGIINYNFSGKKYKRDLVKRENDYNKYIAETEVKIRDLRTKERIISAQKYPSLEEEMAVLERYSAQVNPMDTLMPVCGGQEILNLQEKLEVEGNYEVESIADSVNQILDDITKYERYCEEHPNFKNARTVATQKIIMEVYQKCVREGSFL